MRIGLVNQTIDEQIAEMQREIQELKAPQFTSQNSGMLGKICRAALYDQYGDIVEFTPGGSTTPTTTSRIALPATPEAFYYNTVECTQIFIPKHAKPAVAVPYMKLKVDSNGLHGESEFIVTSGGGFRVHMNIYNSSNVKVGEAFIAQDQGEYLRPIYNPNSDYAWQSNINYTCTVPFILSYELLVRSSDSGVTSSALKGYW